MSFRNSSPDVSVGSKTLREVSGQLSGDQGSLSSGVHFTPIKTATAAYLHVGGRGVLRGEPEAGGSHPRNSGRRDNAVTLPLCHGC